MRGRLDRGRAEEVLGFWSARRALPDEEAQRRLHEVVCLLRRAGALTGVTSAYEADVALIGGRSFWVYRSLLDPVAADHAPAMLRETFRALEAEFDGSPGSPLGLCVLVADSAERARRPEAEWEDPRLVYAGYGAGGQQLRIGYFKGALIRHSDA